MDDKPHTPTTTDKAVTAVVKGYRLVDRVLLAAKLFVLVGLGPFLLLLAGEYLLGGIAFSLLVAIVGVAVYVRRRPTSSLSTATAPTWLIIVVAISLLAGFLGLVASLG